MTENAEYITHISVLLYIYYIYIMCLWTFILSLEWDVQFETPPQAFQQLLGHLERSGAAQALHG